MHRLRLSKATAIKRLLLPQLSRMNCLPNHKNKLMRRDNSNLFMEHEVEESHDVNTHHSLPFPYIHIINFHKNDLPFTYASVDSYAKKMIAYCLDETSRVEPLKVIATAVHGPGAGLDSSEAMEKMILAFAEVLRERETTGRIEEI